MRFSFSLFACLVFLAILAVSCSSGAETAVPTAQIQAAQPQSALESQQPTSTNIPAATNAPPPPPATQSVAQPPKPTPTIQCSDNLTFVADLTVPDGSYIARASEVDKRWQVRNTGTCNWDERYRLVLVAGPELGLPKEQALYPARAGSEAMIRLLLTAPAVPGVYTCAWQAFNPEGEPFGEVIYIQFQVN